MSQNVKIPVSLFNETINLLETLNFMDFQEDFRSLLDNVLGEFRHKKDGMALRETYSKIVCAKDDDERFDARIKYLQERRRLKGGS